MELKEYGDGDWTTGEIAAAKALWNNHNPHRTVEKLHPSIADAWMIYLRDARICFDAAVAAIQSAE